MSFIKDLFATSEWYRDRSARNSARTPSNASSFVPDPEGLFTEATAAAWCISQYDELIWILRNQYHKAWDKDHIKNSPQTRKEVDHLHEELRKATTAQYVNWLQIGEYCRMMKRETTDFYQGPRVQERDRAMKDMRWLDSASLGSDESRLASFRTQPRPTQQHKATLFHMRQVSGHGQRSSILENILRED
nr:hypothetical protein CFP56_20446 [Quercus suber]